MDSTPLKNFLTSFFATLLKALGGAAVAHRLVSPDAATGLLSYADPLAALVLIGSGHLISYMQTDAFHQKALSASQYGEKLFQTFDNILKNHFVTIPVTNLKAEPTENSSIHKITIVEPELNK